MLPLNQGQDYLPAVSHKLTALESEDTCQTKPTKPAGKITALLVLGMHHGGTLAFSRAFSLLGANFLSNSLQTRVGKKIPGCRDSPGISRLNDDILDSVGSSWDDWRRFNFDLFLAGEWEIFKSRALDILTSEVGNSTFFILQDPRICRLLPFWLEVLRDMGAETKCLVVIRNPLEVAALLRSREGFSSLKSQALWLRYLIDLEKDSRLIPRTFCHYEDLLCDWREVIARLAGDLDLAWPRRFAISDEKFDRLFDERHPPPVLMKSQIASSTGMTSWVKEAYDVFLELHADCNINHVNQRLDDIRSAFDQSCEFLGALVKDEEIARIEDKAAFSARIGELETQAIQREVRIGELETQAIQREVRIGELETQAIQREVRIGELETYAAQCEAHIGEVEGQAAQREARIGELEGIAAQGGTRVADLHAQLFVEREKFTAHLQTERTLLFRLNAIQISPSWQLARPLRAVECRWPRLVQGMAGVQKLGWWTLTLKLPGRLALRRQAQALLQQGLFNLEWYIQRNPDIVLQGLNPLLHWLIAGWREGRNPNPLFDIHWYLELYADVRKADTNPLLHYLQAGANQGRQPHPLFDTRWYLDHHKDAADSGINPLAHYLRSHPSERRDPHPLFNSAWYLDQHGDVEDDGVNPLVHYLCWGADAGRDPNPFFDTSWYLEQYPNVGKQGLNPLEHYVRWGAAEGWNPCPLFDTIWYVEQHPEIAAAHLNPLAHYLHTGIQHGWPSHPSPLPAPNLEPPTPSTPQSNENAWQQKPAANANELELVASLLPKQEILFRANPGARRILVIDWKPPTPDRDSGSYRMSRILFCLRDAGLEVDFIGDRPAEGPQYAEQLENRRINVIIGREAAIRHLAELGADFKLALLARPEVFERYAPVVRAFAPNARILYDTVDLHWVRIARSVANASSPVEAESLRERSRRYKRIELANARSADITLAISEEEKRTILEEEPGLDVRTLPNIHEIANWRVPFVERRDLFFIGGFDHEPNVDAVRYFVAEVMPLVTRLLPEARFHIVGSNMPPIIRDLASSQVVPVGYVEDVEPYFAQSRLFVAPLRHGAGMKGKVGQSLSFGLPVVTTPIGAEGIGLVDGESALIRDDAEGLAAAIAGLYTDEALWNRLAENGRELIRQRLSVEAVRVQLLALVNG
jgi:glycosyltransferase involved in cell wall biosynthesis